MRAAMYTNVRSGVRSSLVGWAERFMWSPTMQREAVRRNWSEHGRGGSGRANRKWGRWLWRALACWASFHSAQPTLIAK